MSGIRPIQDYAIQITNMVRFTKAYERHLNPIWSIDQNIEMLTRVLVRVDIRSILPSLGGDTVEELSDVLFNILYPAYEKSMEIVNI